MYDLCYACDGTGERDFLSGAACYECNGTGMRPEEPEVDESDRFCPECKKVVSIRDDSTICEDCWHESMDRVYE